MQLRNLNELLQGKLPPNYKIKDHAMKSLTVVGDNYGSTIFALTIFLEEEVTGKEDTLQLVAKMLPRNPYFYKMFQVDVTFVKESSMYAIVAPTLKAFQHEKGVPKEHVIDYFVEYWGSRQCLDPASDILDPDAVLVLENVKFKGFTVGDRAKGFDLAHAKFVLKNLANFHAILIAYRNDRPEEFKEMILPHLNKLDIDGGVKPDSMNEMMQAMDADLLSVPEIVPLVGNVKKQVEMCRNRIANLDFVEDSPFNTFCHGDFWVNNVMIGYDENCKHPKRMKIIDFQFIKFASVVEDILFFIFTSVEESIIPDQIDHLLAVYYDAFVASLQLNGCPLDDFSWER